MMNVSPKIGQTELVPADYSRGKSVPWWVKMGSKLILARLPVSHALWRKLGLFRYGQSDLKWTRERTFASECIDLAVAELGRAPKTVLEFGPGDSLVGAIVSSARGATRIYIIDVGDFASVDVSKYQLLVDDLEHTAPGLKQRINLTSREALLASINATYLTNGLSDLEALPDNEIELSFSLKVMEHVRKAEFEPLMNKLARSMATPSVQRHVVDLHDHMGCGLNSLRFSDAFWENPIVARSGFYTNRIQMPTMVQIAEASGLRVTVPHALVWPHLPTPRTKMNANYSSLSEQDLNVCTFDLVLHKTSDHS
jgi:hypothetical protein